MRLWFMFADVWLYASDTTRQHSTSGPERPLDQGVGVGERVPFCCGQILANIFHFLSVKATDSL